MTDGMTEAHRYQQKQNLMREEQRRNIRAWIVTQLEQWALSSYLTPAESDDAKRLAKEIRTEGEGGERPKRKTRSPSTSSRTRTTRSTTKSSKGA